MSKANQELELKISPQVTQQDPPHPTSSPKAKRKSSPSWGGLGWFELSEKNLLLKK